MSNSALLTKAEHSYFGIDKPDAFCNHCLRFFNFMIIFLNGEKDKNEVHWKYTDPFKFTSNITKVNSTRTKQYSI